MNQSAIVVVVNQMAKQFNIERMKIMKDLSMKDFRVEKDNRTAKEIEYTRDLLPHIFSTDSQLNEVWGSTSNAICDFKLTLIESYVTKALEDSGLEPKETSVDKLGESCLHPMPASKEYKELFTKAILKKAIRFITQHWNVKYIVAHFDEPLPNFHIFLNKPTPTMNNDDSPLSPMPKTGTHKAKVKNQVQPPQEPDQHQKGLETEHRQFLQRQAASQQTNAIEEEKKKALQRKHNLQYRTPYWQNNPNQDGPDPS